jgi:hypothetical protein
MKKIPLTQGQFAIVDDDDYADLSKFKWYAMWDRRRKVFIAVRRLDLETLADAKTDGRSCRRQRTVFMARAILSPPIGFEVDHANMDTLDNRRSNIRLAQRRQNLMNRRKWGSACRFKGIFRNGKSFTAIIRVKSNRRKSVGTFKTEIEAAKAYNQAAKQHYGEFARLNPV